MKTRSLWRPGYIVVGLLFLVLPTYLVGYKIHRVKYGLDMLVPVEAYKVTLQMSMVSHGDSVDVRTYLPRQTARVTLSDEEIIAEELDYHERDLGDNRLAIWSGIDVVGERRITVIYNAFARAVEYEMDPEILMPGPPRSRQSPYLQATPVIQAEEPEVVALANQLAPAGTSLVSGLRAIHEYCLSLKTVSFKGTTDALTALRLREASCNGKSRLFVALARCRGLPSRLVGGLILEQGTKRTSHQWVEVQIGSHWVPFCPTNDHFARLPANYLPLYCGDEALFVHTRDINFDYRFSIRPNLAIRSELIKRSERDPLNLISVWSTFEKAGIHPELLRVLLMIPLGALILVIFRNVIGFQTFGTFLPVLIAVAARTLGLGWGIAIFFVLLLLVLTVRLMIVRFGLLHLPQLAVMLTFVIIFMLTLAVAGVRSGDMRLAYISMFPIAILAITAERFALMIEEEGITVTIRVALMTAITIAACYLVMNAVTFQVLFLSFPELILVVIFFDIWLGHWMGLRVSEYWRFRNLIAARRGSHAA